MDLTVSTKPSQESDQSFQYRFIKIIHKYVHHDGDALLWILSYVAYCHAVDDIVDGDKNDYEFILSTFRTAETIYTYHFYLQHINTLKPLIHTAHDAYRDSVCMERSLRQENWEKYVGDVIRQQANDVILAVILIVSGIDARNAAALELRKLSYETHHNEKGERV